jgi:hypothetical protein
MLACVAAVWLMGGCDRVCGDMHPEWYVAGDAEADTNADADADADAKVDADADAKVDMTTADRLDEDGAGPPIDAAGPDSGCVASLYIMIDSSSSMGMHWRDLTDAMSMFVDAGANTGVMVGIDFFPEVRDAGEASCEVADYTVPNVPIRPIAGMSDAQSAAIVSAVQNRMFLSAGKPSAAALNGALEFAKMSNVQNVRVLLLTDGQPTGCAPDDTVGAVAAVAGRYAKGAPPIRTYVVGLGAITDTLHPIAMEGGTNSAYVLTNPNATNIAGALQTIVGQVCQ